MRSFFKELKAQSQKETSLTLKAAAIAGFSVGYISQRIPQVDVSITIRDKSTILNK